jgi:PII-like signaling protein
VSVEALKLTTYGGERRRADGGFTADALLDLYEHRGFETSVLLRGAEGFGLRHHLRTDRLLTLSEDLPVVTVAVDERERILAAVPEVERLMARGLVTLERARLVDEPGERPVVTGAVKLTIYVGRLARVGSRSAHRAIVALLRRHGLDGATVLLGVDGTVRGVRERARFLARNADVPLMVIAIGLGERIAEVVPELGRLVGDPLMTLERVQVCKRDGRRLATPAAVPERDVAGLHLWQKLMIYAGEQAHHAGRPLHEELIRRLRAEGAAGATALRGMWGYSGDHDPHGDTLWSLRRRVPMVTVIVDTPPQIARWFGVVDEVTAEHGLVTSEIVPAFRAAAPEASVGGLRLAAP